METQKATNKLYGGNKVYSPDGVFMFTCSDKKFLWYVNRNLMEVKSDPPNGEGYLNFEPGGMGKSDKPELFVKKENKCVVCGSLEDLNRHHVVPRRYRKNFPEDMKKSLDYDVFAICIDCHESYEEIAMGFDDFLFEKYGTEKNLQIEKTKHYSLAKAIYLFSEKIPRKILEEKKDKFYFETGIEPTENNLKEYIEDLWDGRNKRLRAFDPYRDLVNSLDNLDLFVIEWRQHFVDSMTPKHIPDGWKINGPTNRN